MKRLVIFVLIALILFQSTAVFADEKKSDVSEGNVLEKSGNEKNLLFFSDAGWKNYFTASAEIVVTNLVVYNFCTLILDQSWKKINPEIMWKNFTSPWLWDTSSFLRNQAAHPYFGNMYFTAARSNGLNFWQSFLMTAAGSFLWENCIEAGNNSLNDFITTTFSGAVVGEVLYRLGNEGARIHPLLGALFNPVGGLNSILTGRKLGCEKSSVDSLSFDLGGGLSGEKIESLESGEPFSKSRLSPKLFFAAEIVYQNPYGHRTKEFMDQFTASISGNVFGGGYYLQADLDGEFFSVPLYINQNADSNAGVSMNYDVTYSDSGCLSLNSLGAFFKQKINYGANYFAYGAELGFVFFGVTENCCEQSGAFAKTGDLTYTFGPIGKFYAEFDSPLAGNFYLGTQLEYLNSYGNTPKGKKLSGNFLIFNLDASYVHKVYKIFSLGIRGELSKKIRTDAEPQAYGKDFFAASVFARVAL